jgi:hypothetical protein
VPLRSPTFLAGSRLKETCHGERAARAGTRGVERVAGDKVNPIVLIVKLRNILRERKKEADKSKGGEDSMSAPPRGKLK